MKPNILIWAYLALAYLVLANALDVANYLYVAPPIAFPFLSAALFALAAVAVVGLIGRASWARTLSSSVLGLAGLLSIIAGVLLTVIITGEGAAPNLLSALLGGGIFLLLAYKIYASATLKGYLYG